MTTTIIIVLKIGLYSLLIVIVRKIVNPIHFYIFFFKTTENACFFARGKPFLLK